MRNSYKIVAASVLLIGVMAISLTGTACTGNSSTVYCTDNNYPLYCPNAHYCCPAGHPYYCDGMCSDQQQLNCVQVDTCTRQ